MKELAPQGTNVPLADEKSEAVTKKKKKKAHMPLDAAKMQWNANQIFQLTITLYPWLWLPIIHIGLQASNLEWKGFLPLMLVPSPILVLGLVLWMCYMEVCHHRINLLRHN